MKKKLTYANKFSHQAPLRFEKQSDAPENAPLVFLPEVERHTYARVASPVEGKRNLPAVSLLLSPSSGESESEVEQLSTDANRNGG